MRSLSDIWAGSTTALRVNAACVQQLAAPALSGSVVCCAVLERCVPDKLFLASPVVRRNPLNVAGRALIFTYVGLFFGLIFFDMGGAASSIPVRMAVSLKFMAQFFSCRAALAVWGASLVGWVLAIAAAGQCQ